MSVSLISMDKDEAKVAEGVTTYKRVDIESQLAALNAEVLKDTALVNQFAEDIRKLTVEMEKAKARLDVNSYKVELFVALKEAFDRDFPIQSEQKDVVSGEGELPEGQESTAENKDDVE